MLRTASRSPYDLRRPRTSMAGEGPIADDHAKQLLCACIDIGSNTTRLLVAEAGPGGLREVLAQRCFTRLTEGCDPDGAIADAKLPEVAEVVRAQVAAARE